MRLQRFTLRRSYLSALLLGALIAASTGCGGGDGSSDMLGITVYRPVDPLTAAEVTTIIMQTADAIDHPEMVIAVVDRIGNILGVYSNASPSIPDNDNLAVSMARSSAFFSNAQAPLTSRTVQFISGPHFPPIFGPPFVPSPCPTSGAPGCLGTVIAPQLSTPGVAGTQQGPLWQINATNRGVPLAGPGVTPAYPTLYAVGKEVPAATRINGTSPGPGITRLHGGAPLYKAGVGAQPGDLPRVVGGVGVWVPGTNGNPEFASMAYAAWTGSAGFRFPPVLPFAGAIYLNGILLPYIDFPSLPPGVAPGNFGAGVFVVPSTAGQTDPFGALIASRDSFVPGGLTAAQVQGIIDRCIDWANGTRAAIRLPLGSSAKMVICVTDLDGYILGLHRMEDATIFSIDVAVAKARCVTYLSSPGVDPADQIPGVPPGTAVTTRTLGFLSQPFFPPGIQSSPGPGPLYVMAMENQFPMQANRMATAPAQAGRQNGVIFFPGATPLYDAAGQLVGGLGVSGDGVEQDDFVTAAGATGFLPPPAIRADNFSFGGVLLPYFKFPQNPGPGGN
ncbi:MAG: heme-binding protein [Planctomycetes bacterium]|nr:heme-binding protein [Planctomycetota bacterium]